MSARTQIVPIWMAIILIGIAALIGWGSPAPFHNNVSLGTWKNFPPATSCDISLVPNNVTGKVCELMGNSSYRQVLYSNSGGFAGLQAVLSVGCITPSIGGAATTFLQLQYALYNQVTNLNTTNWQNIASGVEIDNMNVNAPCPGNLTSSAAGALNTTTTNGYIFRVVGADGGGSGDNPRFSYVSVLLSVTENQIFIPQISVLSSNTVLTILARTNIPVKGANAVAFTWIATNASSTNPSCGTNLTGGSFVCWQKGTATCTIAAGASSCSIATTYPTAFTGTTKATATVTTGPNSVLIPIGSLSLFSAPTQTV